MNKIYLLENSDMSKSDIHKIIDYSEKLQSMIDPNQKLEDWIKAKLTHAVDYLNTVFDYLSFYVEIQPKNINEYNKPRKGMKSRWSVQRKKKINCKNPKGFSEKQYCKRKKSGGKYKNENYKLNKKSIYFLLNEDYNAEMSMGDLKNINAKARLLQKIINPSDVLEDWVKAKLNLTGEYLDDVYHHLDYKKQNKDLNEVNFKKYLTTTALFLSTLLPVQSDSYVVNKGDTLSGISKNLKIDIETLKDLNKNIDPNKLQIGQIIKVPDKETNVYKIEKGDTLSGIAKKLKINTSELINLNSSIDPNKIEIGQIINIPDTSEIEKTMNQSVETSDDSSYTQNSSDFNQQFKKYLKFNENSIRKGFNEETKKWYQYKSEEGGTDTIAYGHKLTPDQQKSGEFKNGITEEEADELFENDLKTAENAARNGIGSLINKYKREPHKYPSVKRTSFDELGTKEKMMLIDFAFNLGTITGFPKFVNGLLNGDIDKMKKEYERSYTEDKTGKRKTLAQRNNTFYQLFLKNYKFGN